MTEESDRMLVLLQELAAMKDAQKARRNTAPYRKRSKEIKNEMKQLAVQKKRADEP